MKHLGHKYATIFTTLLLTAISVGAQTIVGPPQWTTRSVETVASISYFRYTATLPLCNYIQLDQITRTGTNLSMVASTMRGELCPECVDCYYSETNATVLGTLPAGDYQLKIFAPNGSTPGVGPSPFSVINFNVPNESEPPLTIAQGASALQMQVKGVPAAGYTVEASTTLTNWHPVFEATGGPATFSTNAVDGSSRFYRLRVDSGSVGRPE